MSLYVAIYMTAVLILATARLDDWNRRVNRPVVTATAGFATGMAFICAWLAVFA